MKIEHIDLNLLSVFQAIIEEGQTSRAAERLGISQPAVSHALARLRFVLADPLFVRSAKGMQPTNRALVLAPTIRSALESLNAAFFEQVQFDPGISTRKFQVASDDFVGGALINQIMQATAREAPHIQMTLPPVRGDQTAEALAAGTIDLALRVNPAAAAGIRKRALFSEDFVVLMDRKHPLAKKELTLTDYLNFPHVLVTFSGDLSGTVDAVLAKKGKRRYIRQGVANFSSAPWAIVGTNALVTLPRRVAAQFTEQLGLRMVEPPLKLPGFTISLVWHERSQNDPAVQWLREKFYEAAQIR